MNDNGLHPARAFLLALQTPDISDLHQAESLDELAELTASAGYECAGRLVQQREHRLPGTMFGSGKLTEIKERLREVEADVAIFDGNLAPTQGQNLEKSLRVLVDSPVSCDLNSTAALFTKSLDSLFTSS